MNFAWFSATSRLAVASLALGAVGVVTAACGSSATTSCDDAGENCMVCDGYGCSATGPNVLDAAPDALTTHSTKGDKDDGGKTDGKGETKPDSGDNDHHDAGHDAAPVRVCGVSGGPCACTSSATCKGGEECIAGACEPTSSVCLYSSQCADGQVCDNGQCLTGCSTASPCAAGFTCTDGACVPTSSSGGCTSSSDCPDTAPFCVSGTCTLSCTETSQCPTGDYCDDGACVLNTAPSPDCTGPSQCGANQVCQAGYCLYTCTNNAGCEDIDARIPVCSDNVCRSPSEADPQCLSQAQCNTGESCVNNACM